MSDSGFFLFYHIHCAEIQLMTLLLSSTVREEIFGHFSIFDETLRHIELYHSVKYSEIQQNLPTVYVPRMGKNYQQIFFYC